MDLNKVLYISQEISPYLPDTPMALMSRQLPQAIQEKGAEVRIFMPKYGYINERRHQLHEVIRLSGMNLIIDDTDHPLIIKVATLQPARMQVYFIFNEDYFNKNISEELETDLSPLDNDERSIFFVRGTLETMKKQRWVPDVIHCSGWLSALAPLYIKDFYGDDPSFQNAKVVYTIFDNELPEPFDVRFYEKLKFDGMKESNIKALKDKKADLLELTKLALKHSDGVIQGSENIDPEIMDFITKSKIPFLPYQKSEDFNVETYAEFYQSL
ncbi:MAG: glycogen/starch synthase [Muribaculaceae bacterium]|nr:glycogen/starch synthase [Muribaculaceae bacterium]